jgi:hypothetical protein
MTKKMIIGLILDESQSMSSIKTGAMSGVNEFIQTQKKAYEEHPELGKIYLSLVTFSDTSGWFDKRIEKKERVRFLSNMADIEEVPLLTDADYRPDGQTPLCDAIGKTIESIDKYLKDNAPKKKKKKMSAAAAFMGVEPAEDDETKIIVVIQTDGGENSSKEFNKTKIQEMIKKREADGNWTFVFLGADIDAIGDGMALGMNAGSSVAFKGSNESYGAVYDSAAVGVSMMRGSSVKSISNFGEEMKSRISKEHLNDKK